MLGRSRLLFASIAVALAVTALFTSGAPSASAVATLAIGPPGETGAEATAYSPTFSDVPDDHLFASSIRAIFISGITRGCNEGMTEFCPDRVVTRGQMAAFLTRALKLPEGETADFTDDNGHTFENAIERLAAARITLGCNPPANDRFCPDRMVTRGEMSAFLTRALDLTAPSAVPVGVQIAREATDGNGRGTRLTVCRETELSLVVRSAVGGIPGVGRAVAWEPTISVIPVGEVDLPTDRWYLPAAPPGCETLELAWDPRVNTLVPPLTSLEVKSAFGPRHHPILGYVRLHAGVDLDSETGDPVFATAPGMVIEAGVRGGYGQMVDVRHIGGLTTRYAHLSTLAVVEGDAVAAGDTVGNVGCTGLCTAPHLHFETLEFDEPVDPMSYLGG